MQYEIRKNKVYLMNKALALLSLFVFGSILLSGCLQEENAQERGEPPLQAFVPLVENPQHDIINVSGPAEE